MLPRSPRRVATLLAVVLSLACSSSESPSAVVGGGGSAGSAGAAGNAGTAGVGGAAGGPLGCSAPTATYAATGTDQSAIVADATTKEIADATITSDSVTSSQDQSSFYGLNAAVLAKNGGAITLTCSSVSTTGAGANGVFATGAGSAITLTSVTIQCTGDGGHGVDATLGATLTLEDVDIDTAGSHGAAIATDRGGGAITATRGTVRTSGVDSPGIYSTGAISVTGATIAATGAEAAVIEGANAITLVETALSAAKGTRDRGAMIYQSTSGDAPGTGGVFSMTGGSFDWPSTTGPLFFVTNTTAVIGLNGVAFANASPTFLKAGADQWGTTGSNGGAVQLTTDSQSIPGNFVLDAPSSLDAKLRNGSSLVGAIDVERTAGSVVLSLDASSTWTVTADSKVSTLTDADETLANVVGNGHSICYASSVNGRTSGTWALAGGGSVARCE